MIKLLLCALTSLWLAGCATLPDEGPRSTSIALPAQGPATPLDRLAQASMADAPAGQSGFRLLLGPGALDARIALLRGAGRSLDLQYYHLHDDATGRLVLRELRDAARRGVRVRLLVDDLYTEGLEPLLSGLAAYPNAEVRIFNPFPTRGSLATRVSAALFDFARVNRRMHNKLFVADGVAAVTGGRNLGDEYFMRGAEANFFDYDVLAIGQVVPQMASLFDAYWNAPQVRTAASVLRPRQSAETLRHAFDARVDGPDTPDPPPYRGLDRLGRLAIADEIAAGRMQLQRGAAQAFADAPAKAWGQLESARLPSGALIDSTRRLLANEMRQAREEVWMSSPYMVPGAEGLAAMQANGRRGVRMSLVTNSLAATDEPVVHTGYRRYRHEMLRAGVEIYELSSRHGQRLLLPDAAARGTVIRLHTKSAIVDRRLLFIGSINMDPRSEALNTEFGLLIQSPALAAEAQQIMQLLKREASWQVRLAPDGRSLEWLWTDPQAAGQELLDDEPDVGWWTRVKVNLLSVLVPENLL